MRAGVAGAVERFLHMEPHGGAHRVALRAGVSVAVPLLVVVLLGRPQWSAYVAFGAFASLYGRNHVHLSRTVMQASVGAALVTSVTLGVLVGCLDTRRWVAVPVAAAVAAVGSLLSTAQDWHPPGPLFLVFGFGAVASVPHDLGDVPVAVLASAASAVLSVLVGNAGAFLRRQRSLPARLAPVWTWQPVRLSVATAVSGTVATASGVGHPYWATVAAVAPLTARGVTGQLVRAGHRIIGTLLGLGTSALLLSLRLDPVPTVLVVAGLQIATELLVGRNYALALLFITPLALLMGQLAAPRPVHELLFERGVETVIGASVAVAVVLLTERSTRVRRGRWGTGPRRGGRPSAP